MAAVARIAARAKAENAARDAKMAATVKTEDQLADEQEGNKRLIGLALLASVGLSVPFYSKNLERLGTKVASGGKDDGYGKYKEKPKKDAGKAAAQFFFKRGCKAAGFEPASVLWAMPSCAIRPSSPLLHPLKHLCSSRSHAIQTRIRSIWQSHLTRGRVRVKKGALGRVLGQRSRFPWRFLLFPHGTSWSLSFPHGPCQRSAALPKCCAECGSRHRRPAAFPSP